MESNHKAQYNKRSWENERYFRKSVVIPKRINRVLVKNVYLMAKEIGVKISDLEKKIYEVGITETVKWLETEFILSGGNKKDFENKVMVK